MFGDSKIVKAPSFGSLGTACRLDMNLYYFFLWGIGIVNARAIFSHSVAKRPLTWIHVTLKAIAWGPGAAVLLCKENLSSG